MDSIPHSKRGAAVSARGLSPPTWGAARRLAVEGHRASPTGCDGADPAPGPCDPGRHPSINPGDGLVFVTDHHRIDDERARPMTPGTLETFSMVSRYSRKSVEYLSTSTWALTPRTFSRNSF